LVSIFLWGVFGSKGGSVVASWLVVDRGSVVDGGSVVDRGRLVRGRGNLHHWGRLIRGWGRFVRCWSRFIRCWGRCVDNRGRFVWGWGRFVWGWGRFVWGWGWDNLHHWGRGDLDDRSRLVGCWGRGGLVCWGWGGLVRLDLGVDSLALVLDISNITFWSSRVGNDLHTTVGEVDPVLPIGVVVSAVLLLGEHSSGILRVVHSILIIVHRREVWVCFLGGVWGRGTGR